MVRKRRKKSMTLQARVNGMWPEAVQAALEDERRGGTIPQATQLQLLGLVVAALEDKRAAAGPPPEGAIVKIQILGAKLRAYRVSETEDGARVQEYLGDVGEW